MTKRETNIPSDAKNKLCVKKVSKISRVEVSSFNRWSSCSEFRWWKWGETPSKQSNQNLTSFCMGISYIDNTILVTVMLPLNPALVVEALLKSVKCQCKKEHTQVQLQQFWNLLVELFVIAESQWLKEIPTRINETFIGSQSDEKNDSNERIVFYCTERCLSIATPHTITLKTYFILII